MRISWRHVSALLVLLTLVAAACSSDPVDVISGDDDGNAPIEEAADEITSETDDAMEDEASSAVAEDSAPRVTTSERQDELLAALAEAQAVWMRNSIEDYDFTMFNAVTTPSSDWPASGSYEIEVRRGQVTRVLPQDEFADELNDFTIAELLDELNSAIVSEAGFTVDFDDEFGHPQQMRGDDGNSGEYVVLIENFRVVGDYPDQCSTAGIAVDELQSPTANDAVNATRRSIFDALANCDFLLLSHLANRGDVPFTGSFGGDGIALVWEAEASGEPVMMDLLEVLLRDAATTDGIFVWPAEFADPQSNYLDWRVGIDDQGEWLFFVTGD